MNGQSRHDEEAREADSGRGDQGDYHEAVPALSRNGEQPSFTRSRHHHPCGDRDRSRHAFGHEHREHRSRGDRVHLHRQGERDDDEC